MQLALEDGSTWTEQLSDSTHLGDGDDIAVGEDSENSGASKGNSLGDTTNAQAQAFIMGPWIELGVLKDEASL